ncbi:hypothetical protein HGM15179_022060, partial [Zosterops borbonicus]
MAAGPGAAGAARVSSGRDLNCVPEVAGALGAVARQGLILLFQALKQELDFGAYLGLAAHLVPLRGPHNPNLARGLSAHLNSGHHATQ